MLDSIAVDFHHPSFPPPTAFIHLEN